MARSSSASVLPTPVRTISGREAGAQRDVDLADRVRVGAGAEAAQQAAMPSVELALSA